jgi:hypothetical protein
MTFTKKDSVIGVINKRFPKLKSYICYLIIYIALLSPIFLLTVFVKKLQQLDCLSIETRIYISIIVIFIYAYVVKNYVYFIPMNNTK